MEYLARPLGIERISLAYPNISAKGTSAVITTSPARGVILAAIAMGSGKGNKTARALKARKEAATDGRPQK